MDESYQKPPTQSSNNSDIGAGDVPQNENMSKQSQPTKTPPPVRPRPTTAHGSRTPNLPKEKKSAEQIKSKEAIPCESNSHSASHRNFDDIPTTSRGTSSSTTGSFSSEGKSKQSGSYVSRVQEEERRVGEQGRMLMNMFIRNQAEAEQIPQEPIIREVCLADASNARALGFDDDSLNDIAVTLRRIGDDISQNVELNNFIDQVPVHSTREIFLKVCTQIFQDGDLNWGRVVALFYFAYRLIMRTLAKGMDSIPWVRDMLKWAGDFLVKNIAHWVYNKGGWQMIKEWFGPSNQTWMMLFFGSLVFGLWAYFKKN